MQTAIKIEFQIRLLAENCKSARRGEYIFFLLPRAHRDANLPAQSAPPEEMRKIFRPYPGKC